MASTLYENVGEWHTNVVSRDIPSLDETEPSDFTGDTEADDDEYEEVSPKQNSLKEMPEDTSLAKTETEIQNGHDNNGMIDNGNGIHEIDDEDSRTHNDRDDEENEEDDIDENKVNGEEDYSDRASAEVNEDDRAPPMPYYGRTLVAPEYMNFQLEETPQREEKATEDDNDKEIAVADESGDLGSPIAEEEIPGQTFQKEVLEEEDLTLSEEESDEDEDGNVEEEDQRVRVDCQVAGEHEEEEQEREEEDEDEREEEEGKEEEGKEQEDTAGENFQHAPDVYSVDSPQLAQAEDDEEEDEEEVECDEMQEEGEGEQDGQQATQSKTRLQLTETEDDEEEDEEEVECDEMQEEGEGEQDGQQATQSKTRLQLTETDDDDEHDKEIEIETTNECNLKHSDSLKVQVASPTPDSGEVGSVGESFDDGEGVTTEDDDGDGVDPEAEQEFIKEDRYFNETVDQHEERRKTFNGPVQEFENQGKKHVQGDEGDHDRCESEDTEEDSSDDTVIIVETEDKHTCNAEGGADLDTIPEGVDVEGNSEVQDEKYSVHNSSQEKGNESDLAGKVKELGRMFEGGGPVFPKTLKNDTDAVDGSPVSVRRYKAIFEQDQLSAERAREPGRREELTGPPQGIVKNLRGLFENPQGFEARKG